MPTAVAISRSRRLQQFSESGGATLVANGAGTVLDLTSLTSLDGATGYGSLAIDAQAGGEINLSNLANDPSGSTSFSADAASSVIDLADLTNLASNAAYSSTLSATDSGQIELTTGTINLTNVNLSANSGGTVTGGTVHLLPGSSLSGDSTIQADVENAGVITPGDRGIGVLTIDGSLSQYADGTLNIQLAGTTAGTQYDQLAVTGAFDANGTIAVSLANGFTPQIGNQFSVVTYASQSGEYSTYTGLGYATGATFQTVYGTSSFNLVAATADIRVFPATGLFTSQAGDFATFTVELAVAPTANVTVNLSSSNTSVGTVSPATLTFTTADWNVPQTVTVTGVNDHQSGSVRYQVVFSPAVSSDSSYSGLTPASVSVTNLPSEVQNIKVTNLAVNPSTGLNQGSAVTVTWNDLNAGDLSATSAWDDQIVITNTTTGDTLATRIGACRSGRRWRSESECRTGRTVFLHAADRGGRHRQHSDHDHREHQPHSL